ncbi:MAG: hypothetical protein AB7P21_30390 [Lautropia sp.]
MARSSDPRFLLFLFDGRRLLFERLRDPHTRQYGYRLRSPAGNIEFHTAFEEAIERIVVSGWSFKAISADEGDASAPEFAALADEAVVGYWIDVPYHWVVKEAACWPLIDLPDWLEQRIHERMKADQSPGGPDDEDRAKSDDLDDAGDPFNGVSVERYASAFKAVSDKITPKQRAMLIGHAQSYSVALSTRKIAALAGESKYQVANRQYGALGKVIAEALGVEPVGDMIGAICVSAGVGDERNEFQWILRQNALGAVANLGWLTDGEKENDVEQQAREFVRVPYYRESDDSLTHFLPSVRAPNGYQIGPKGHEVFVEDYWEALEHLLTMPRPRFRRSNAQGNRGIVTCNPGEVEEFRRDYLEAEVARCQPRSQ